jgi:hypothetical protein
VTCRTSLRSDSSDLEATRLQACQSMPRAHTESRKARRRMPLWNTCIEPRETTTASSRPSASTSPISTAVGRPAASYTLGAASDHPAAQSVLAPPIVSGPPPPLAAAEEPIAPPEDMPAPPAFTRPAIVELPVSVRAPDPAVAKPTPASRVALQGASMRSLSALGTRFRNHVLTSAHFSAVIPSGSNASCSASSK